MTETNFDIAAYEKDVADLETRIAELEEQLAETDQAIVDRLLRMKELDKENACLKEQLKSYFLTRKEIEK